ncbi:MAG: PACE efflux transporter [Gemmobacter sp.]
MTLRSSRERLLQTVAFEAGGLALVVPLYAVATGAGSGESLALFVALSVAVMLWSPLFNTAFDLIDLRLTGRLASDRPHRLRLVHAVLHEVSTVVVTLPVIMVIGGHGWLDALALDVALTVVYAAYAYVFHLAYDRWRPVRRTGISGLHRPDDPLGSPPH